MTIDNRDLCIWASPCKMEHITLQKRWVEHLIMFNKSPVSLKDGQKLHQLNYDQVSLRDFNPSALAFLMNGEPKVVKNFLLKNLRLQSWEKKVDRFKLGDFKPKCAISVQSFRNPNPAVVVSSGSLQFLFHPFPITLLKMGIL
ncbi:hypothetical protein POM88_036212 [Heracleum sosnowskyi]|uniref:Uncharacterized protein n=1 Tax=Heracleum sosnowskyi TaxID=360622 RepID=A0AAD8HQ30_9APIA|nr:hypothetical protein POM88_036212 [Heracleum sosnowskyi]